MLARVITVLNGWLTEDVVCAYMCTFQSCRRSSEHKCSIHKQQCAIPVQNKHHYILARSKRETNQTMFDIADPLDVHVLLLIHEFMFDQSC